MAKQFQITFNATPEEIEVAYKAFQNKYALRKRVIYTIVYLIVLVLGIDLIIKNPSSIAGYIASGLSAGILIFNWIKPVTIRKRLIKTLSELNDENYTMSFYDTRLEIETVIDNSAPTETVAITTSGIYTVEEGSEAEKELSKEAPKEEEIPKTVYNLSETEITFMEKDELIMMFVNRSYIHTIPKRCLSEEEIKLIEAYYTDKALY